MVEDDRVTEFPKRQSEEQPERKCVNLIRGEFVFGLHSRKFVRIRSEMQFQQSDFERERLMDVGVQQPLCLFERLQIFQSLTR